MKASILCLLGSRLYHVSWNMPCGCDNVEEHVNGSPKSCVFLLRRFIAMQLCETNNLEYQTFTLLWVLFSRGSYLMKGALTYYK